MVVVQNTSELILHSFRPHDDGFTFYILRFNFV